MPAFFLLPCVRLMTTGAMTLAFDLCFPLIDLLLPVPVHGYWSEWSSWSQCSQPCGDGSKERMRFCDNPEPQYGGRFCDGGEALSNQQETCNEGPCPSQSTFDPLLLPLVIHIIFKIAPEGSDLLRENYKQHINLFVLSASYIYVHLPGNRKVLVMYRMAMIL